MKHNTVTFKPQLVAPEFIPGDLFTDGEGALYILGVLYTGNRKNYIAISLADGERWSDPSSLKESVDGLTFVGRGMNISVT